MIRFSCHALLGPDANLLKVSISSPRVDIVKIQARSRSRHHKNVIPFHTNPDQPWPRFREEINIVLRANRQRPSPAWSPRDLFHDPFPRSASLFFNQQRATFSFCHDLCRIFFRGGCLVAFALVVCLEQRGLGPVDDVLDRRRTSNTTRQRRLLSGGATAQRPQRALTPHPGEIGSARDPVRAPRVAARP